MFKIKYIRTNLLNSAFDEYLDRKKNWKKNAVRFFSAGVNIAEKENTGCRFCHGWVIRTRHVSQDWHGNRFLLFCDKWNYLSFPIERFSKISAACLLSARQSFRPHLATIVARLSPSTIPAVFFYVVHNV